jgi:Gluconate 2-dehydrogenase subunit 3
MNRREAIRFLATGAALPLAPAKMLAMLREARAVVAALASPRTLNPHQYETVKTIAEMILPRTDTPGATDVGAGDFIDLILTEWCSNEERTRFLSGIGDVDSRAQSLFGKDFVSCSPIQQADILTALGEKMVEELPRAAGPEWHGDWASRHGESFYTMLRRLTLTAYFTSEAGATEALHYEIIPATHNGCAEEQAVEEVSERQ